MADRAAIRDWVARYEHAWRTAGTGPLEALFTPDATYSTAPYAPLYVGLDAIAKMWEAEREGPDEIFTMTSDVVAVEGDTGVVRLEVRYGEPVRQEYRDLWVVTLDPDGRCRSFEEWPFAPLDSDSHRVAALRANLLEVQAAERRRVARAMHDDPIQVLTVAVMRLDLLGAPGGNNVDPEVAAQVQEARAAVREGIDRLRTMLFELHPPSLETEGLVAAIDEYTRELFAGSPIAVEIDATEAGPQPTLAVRSALFRVAREAIANVHKHAGANHLGIRVRDVQGGVEVRIADDGRGFTPSDEHDPFHRGLDFAAELARGAGGWWSISSTPAGGTIVEFWLPDAVV